MDNNNIITVDAKEWNELKSILFDLRDKLNRLTAEVEKDLLTPAEVCEKLKISRWTFKRYIDDGVLDSVKIKNKNNGRVYVKRSQLEKLIDEGRI
ncbi:MAG: helix-turn-helix domain-containing protein [Dysgonomonas sp.]|uniref:helix-turn-helix domain-containing protein n=1 Tax=Dysgonomonas sp. TaxID=1891233 RepID=UPI0039E4E641